MPYIKQCDRNRYEEPIRQLEQLLCNVPTSHVTYVIYRLIMSRWKFHKSYQTGVDIMGCLTTAGHEFMRQHLDAYEDDKKEEEGDV
jgi:hypothetical protein